MSKPDSASPSSRLYDDPADMKRRTQSCVDRVSLLPTGPIAAGIGPGAVERIRVMWGQDMLRDMLDGRYRSVVCGVNDADNAHGIIAQLVDLIPASQWTPRGVTSFAKLFQDSVSIHAARDREPYVLKYDLDSLLILAILRPSGKDHFTLDELSRGFGTVVKMLRGRKERQPVASVGFLNARVNKLVGPDGTEPSFEAVLRTMYNAGFRGDVYPAPSYWRLAHTGVFPSYPFPEGSEHGGGGGGGS